MKLTPRIKWRHVRALYEMLAPSLKASAIKQTGPDRGRVLVLAPHIDDEAIGAGGALSKHVQAGDEVKIVYFADCTEERIAEAREAASVLGVTNLEFFEYGPKTLANHPEIADQISSVFSDYRPEIVYVPSLFDRHNDHLAVNNYLAVFHLRKGYQCTVCAYEVWTPLVPNLIVDISDVIGMKSEAIGRFTSQLRFNDWLEAATALNRYRGITSGAGKYAEGFMRYSLKEYCSFWKTVYGT